MGFNWAKHRGQALARAVYWDHNHDELNQMRQARCERQKRETRS